MYLIRLAGSLGLGVVDDPCGQPLTSDLGGGFGMVRDRSLLGSFVALIRKAALAACLAQGHGGELDSQALGAAAAGLE